MTFEATPQFFCSVLQFRGPILTAKYFYYETWHYHYYKTMNL